METDHISLVLVVWSVIELAAALCMWRMPPANHAEIHNVAAADRESRRGRYKQLVAIAIALAMEGLLWVYPPAPPTRWAVHTAAFLALLALSVRHRRTFQMWATAQQRERALSDQALVQPTARQPRG